MSQYIIGKHKTDTALPLRLFFHPSLMYLKNAQLIKEKVESMLKWSTVHSYYGNKEVLLDWVKTDFPDAIEASRGDTVVDLFKDDQELLTVYFLEYHNPAYKEWKIVVNMYTRMLPLKEKVRR